MVIMTKKKYNELMDRIKQLEIYKEELEPRIKRLEGIGAMEQKKSEPRNQQVISEWLHGKAVE